MRATIEEFVNGKREAVQTIALDHNLTIGRNRGCDVVIGGSLEDDQQWISRIQASVYVAEDGVYLVDGGPDGRSTNRVYHAGAPIDDPLRLSPGMEITLYKRGKSKIQLQIPNLASDEYKSNQPTFTPDLLLEALQTQIEDLGKLVAELTQQVAGLSSRDEVLQTQVDNLVSQANEREKIDQQHFDSINQLTRDLKKIASFGMGAIALTILVSIVSGNPERKEGWHKALELAVQVTVMGSLTVGAATLQGSKEGEKKSS